MTLLLPTNVDWHNKTFESKISKQCEIYISCGKKSYNKTINSHTKRETNQQKKSKISFVKY